ncbi:phenylalanine--tRNA ligase beta subunit-related protein [Gammaproteobacteria bacterium]|nr:phenylalanine--tRNA ligase beta subunit-related protein [Gammaproteobacteria bacterium]
MKIAYKHLVKNIITNPSIDEISDRLFQLGHEHEIEEDIFNIEFTPNRGDCLSLNGLLRDLSVFYDVNINQEIYNEKLNILDIDFENFSQDTCPQISFLKLEIESIPEKYKDYLNDYFIDLNLNKNNFFTDISNYISYENGQPTHCYDAHKTNGKLVFKELDTDQEFKTLLGKKINLTDKNPVFLLNDKVINLAGVVGGFETSCSADTKTALIECAFFKPEAIIGKSVKYDIQSEASYKFERFVDPECQDRTIRRFIKIVDEHTNIKDMSVISYKFKQNKVTKIPINTNKINQIIGINISQESYLSYLSQLGFIINDEHIEVPSYRSDIKTQNDLAEEIARVIGYDNIIRNEITIPKGKKSNIHDLENNLKFFLLDKGFYEIINSPFVGSDSSNSISVDNPLDSNKKYLRSNLTESLLENLLYNERRQKDSIKLFEISDIYTVKNNKINVTRKLGIIASGRAGHNYKDFSKKISKKYLTSVFKETLPNENFGFKVLNRESLNTKVKNEIICCEVDIANFSSSVLSYKKLCKPPESFIEYSLISDLPCSIRDLSFSIKDFTKLDKFIKYILEFKHKLLKEIYIFDYFNNEKNAEIKIGFRFIFQSVDSTITELQVNDIINVIIEQTEQIDGITIPGLT